jgi:integrase
MWAVGPPNTTEADSHRFATLVMARFSASVGARFAAAGAASAKTKAIIKGKTRRYLPAAGGANPNIRYLRPEELEALYRAVPDDDPGPTERALYMTGAMAGLRLGELIGLSWQDIDWSAGVIRVRRSFTHGAWSAPKSRTSSRAVPLADRLAGELERHYQRSAFGHDDDLVFAHPLLGTVLDGSKLRKRFHAALERAEVRPVRLHDLRHSFGTAMAAAGTPMRALMEFMGHATMATTMIYADYSPDPSGGVEHANRAFAVPGSTRGSNLTESEVTPEHPKPL